MAFPAVEASASTNGSTAATSHAVTLPATVSANSLLVVVGRVAVAGTVAVTGGGWTIVQDSADVDDDISFWMYRDTLADGTEDGTTITVTHGNGKLAAIALSITGAENPATQAPQTSTIAFGSSATPGPTAATPTGGAKDYLWIAAGMWSGEQTSPPATIPANYGGSVGADTGTAGVGSTNTRTAIATRQLNAASEDPGTWTISAASGWSSWTIAVHPSSAVSETPTPGGAIAAGNALVVWVPVPQGGALAGGVAPTESGGGVSETPTPGGAIASGNAPVVRVAAVQGGALAAGLVPGPRISFLQGGAVAGGPIPASRITVTQGGAQAAGQTNAARVGLTIGGAVAGGFAPTDGAAVEETPTPGGAIAGGFSPASRVSLVINGTTAGGQNILLVLVSLASGGAVAGGQLTDPLAAPVVVVIGRFGIQPKGRTTSNAISLREANFAIAPKGRT